MAEIITRAFRLYLYHLCSVLCSMHAVSCSGGDLIYCSVASAAFFPSPSGCHANSWGITAVHFIAVQNPHPVWAGPACIYLKEGAICAFWFLPFCRSFLIKPKEAASPLGNYWATKNWRQRARNKEFSLNARWLFTLRCRRVFLSAVRHKPCTRLSFGGTWSDYSNVPLFALFSLKAQRWEI